MALQGETSCHGDVDTVFTGLFGRLGQALPQAESRLREVEDPVRKGCRTCRVCRARHTNALRRKCRRWPRRRTSTSECLGLPAAASCQSLFLDPKPGLLVLSLLSSKQWAST